MESENRKLIEPSLLGRPLQMFTQWPLRQTLYIIDTKIISDRCEVPHQDFFLYLQFRHYFEKSIKGLI